MLNRSRIKKFLKKSLFSLYFFLAGGIPIPLPRRLSWGDWWLSWGDSLSRMVRDRSFEGMETEILRKLLKPGMVVMDAGAHRGYYTLLASKILGAEGRVISFEPSPRERRWLWLHMKVNGRRNIRIEKFALGAKEETAEFFISLDSQTGCNSMKFPKGVRYSLPICVPVITLDAYCSRYGVSRLDFLKMDVEGAERDVLLGGSDFLRKMRPIIVCELSDIRTLRWKYRPIETVKIIEGLGYACYYINANSGLDPYREKPRYEENILAVPTEKISAVESIM